MLGAVLAWVVLSVGFAVLAVVALGARKGARDLPYRVLVAVGLSLILVGAVITTTAT